MGISCGHSHEGGETHTLKIEGLNVAYRQDLVLEDISLQATCGRCLALVGPNGAGKSTLLKAIGGLVKRRGGSITWSGKEALQCRDGEFAYLPQHEEVNWNFPITVQGVVEMGRYPQLGAFKKFGAKDHAAVKHALELMEMDGELAKRQISELSGGQKQRAFIARAVAQEAHVMLLDEPFTGLDRDHSANLSKLLRSLASESRLVVASHHEISTLTEIFDDTLILNRKVIASGACADVATKENLDLAFTRSVNE